MAFHHQLQRVALITRQSVVAPAPLALADILGVAVSPGGGAPGSGSGSVKYPSHGPVVRRARTVAASAGGTRRRRLIRNIMKTLNKIYQA